MTPDTIARLRTASLAATLTAARGRRVRRRAGGVALAAIAALTVALFQIPRRAPAPAVTAAAPVAHTVRPAPAALVKITTRETARVVRFRTDPARRVERIDTAGLARCFPGKGVAVIRAEGELAKVVIF